MSLKSLKSIRFWFCFFWFCSNFKTPFPFYAPPHFVLTLPSALFPLYHSYFLASLSRALSSPTPTHICVPLMCSLYAEALGTKTGFTHFSILAQAKCQALNKYGLCGGWAGHCQLPSLLRWQNGVDLYASQEGYGKVLTCERQNRVIVNIKGLKFQRLLLALCPWANHTTILGLHFFTDKLEIIFISSGYYETTVRVSQAWAWPFAAVLIAYSY